MKKKYIKGQLTYAEKQLPRPHLLDPRVESLSGNVIQTRMLCVHKRRCVYSHFHQPNNENSIMS